MIEPYVPEDFDEFWAEALQEAEAVPLYFRRNRRNSSDLPGLFVELIEFTAMESTLYGWLAYPEDFEGRLPGFLWLPAYGRESHLPNQYSTRRGFISMSFNFHGHAAFHQEEYMPSRGYFAEGVEDPRTWIFRRMTQDAMIAMRVLQAQVEAHEERLGVAGLSQGGGMAIWLAAQSPLVRAAVADLPFLSAMPDTLSKPVYRYPPKELTDFAETIPLGMQRIQHTISYYDTLNQATRVKVPTLVGLGEKDPAVRPEVVRAAYDAIPTEKKLIEYPTGHDWNPDMIENNRRWLSDHL